MQNNTQSNDITTMTNVLSLMSGAIITQIISAGVARGLPDHLNDNPQDPAKLAHTTDIALPHFMRLVRSWAAFGLLTIDDAGNLLETPLTPLLRQDGQGSFYYRALELGHPELFRVFERLGSSLLDGSNAFEATHKQPMYAFFADRPELNKIFVQDLSRNSMGIGDELARSYDFSAASSIVDIGGGNGTTLTRLLRAWPQLNGVLFERADVKPAAQALLKTEGMTGRCKIVVGDFFKRVPKGYDIYLLKYVLQDWSDDEATTLLRSCRKAMSGSSRLLILEQIIPDQPSPTPQSQSAVLDDLLVFAFTGGGNRTMSELTSIIQAAGLSVDKSSRLPQVNVVECRVS